MAFDITSLLDFATTQTVGGWINLGINLIVSTIVGGIVLIILLKIAGHEWEQVSHIGNAFLIVLIINAINLFGIINYLSPYIPMGSLIIPVVIWIALIKVFFREISAKHVIVIGIVGWLLSIFAVPYLVSMTGEMIPKLF